MIFTGFARRSITSTKHTFSNLDGYIISYFALECQEGKIKIYLASPGAMMR